MSNKIVPSLFSKRYDDFAARFLHDNWFVPMKKVMKEYYGYDYRIETYEIAAQLAPFGCKTKQDGKEFFVDIRTIPSGRNLSGLVLRGTRLLNIVLDMATMYAGKFGFDSRNNIRRWNNEDQNVVSAVPEITTKKKSAAKELPTPLIPETFDDERPSFNVDSILAFSFVDSNLSFSTSKQEI